MAAELGKIELMLRSIAGAIRGLAIVVNPPAHHQLAGFQNPIAPVSDSIFALGAVALCAVAIGLVFSSRGARQSPPAARRKPIRAAGASKTPPRIRIHPRGPHPVLRLAPGRRGKT